MASSLLWPQDCVHSFINVLDIKHVNFCCMCLSPSLYVKLLGERNSPHPTVIDFKHTRKHNHEFLQWGESVSSCALLCVYAFVVNKILAEGWRGQKWLSCYLGIFKPGMIPVTQQVLIKLLLNTGCACVLVSVCFMCMAHACEFLRGHRCGVRAGFQLSSSTALCCFALRQGLSHFSIAVTEHPRPRQLQTSLSVTFSFRG